MIFVKSFMDLMVVWIYKVQGQDNWYLSNIIPSRVGMAFEVVGLNWGK